MAKIILAGDAVVITSALSLEALRKVKKYRPDALNLYADEKKEDLVFSVLVDHGAGIGKNGIGFAAETRDEAKLATLTIMLDKVSGDIKEYIADNFGKAFNNLCKLEEQLPAVIAEIDSEKAAMMAAITEAGN